MFVANKQNLMEIWGKRYEGKLHCIGRRHSPEAGASGSWILARTWSETVPSCARKEGRGEER